MSERDRQEDSGAEPETSSTATDAEEPTPAEGGEPERSERPQRVYAGTGVYGAVLAGLVLAAATIVFVAQNTEAVAIEWIVWELDVALAAVVLAALFLGVVLSVIVGWVWRRSQRRIRSEREELERLRTQAR